MNTKLWRNRFSPEEWSVILKAQAPEDWVELRKATRLGQPWATAEFVQREVMKGIRLKGVRRAGQDLPITSEYPDEYRIKCASVPGFPGFPVFRQPQMEIQALRLLSK